MTIPEDITFTPLSSYKESSQEKGDLVRGLGSASTEPLRNFSREALKSLMTLGGMSTLSPFQDKETAIEESLSNIGLQKQPLQEPASEFIGRFGKILGFGGFFNPVKSLLGAIGGQTAKELGAGETVQGLAEIASTLNIPEMTRNITRRIISPRIANSNVPLRDAGRITGGRLGQQIERIEEEASDLAQNIGIGNQRFQQITRSIERGDPIQQRFNRMFDTLDQAARRANAPLRNLTPINDFLTQESQLYSGTGSPTQLGEFVMNEIRGWQNQGGSGLYNLFRRYRLNNQRIRELASDPNVGRTFRRQANSFLSRMNNSIRETLQNNIPPGNPWMRAFNESNAAYSAYNNTLNARRILHPVINRNMSNDQAIRFIQNENIWEDLNNFLGPNESGDLRTLLQDLVSSRQSLQNMRRFPSGMAALGEIGKSAALKHIGLGKLAAMMHLPKMFQWAVGRYYSGPEFVGNLHQFAQALSERNSFAAIQALRKIEESKSKKEKPKEEITFTPIER